MKPIYKNGVLLTAVLLLSACATTVDVAALHDRTLTLDAHIDIPLTYMDEVNPGAQTDLQVDLPKMRQGQLDGGFWTVSTPQGELTYSGIKAAQEISETRLKAICDMSKAFPDRISLARTAADVRQIESEGRHAALIGMDNAYPLGRTNFAEELKIYTGVGVRYVGLTHFGHNQFGDSSNPHPTRDNGPRWDGLSPAGYKLITALNDAGVMVDVSNAGKDTMMQAAEFSRTPIIAAHSGVKAVADSAHNLDDEQLRKIAEVNGVAQIVASGDHVKFPTVEQKAARIALDAEFGNQVLWSQAKRDRYNARRAAIAAMAPKANVSDFVDHIDHVVAVAGIDHVGIASDFDGGGGLVGWKDASETQNVTAELVARGYTETDIAKIWSGNLLRVMEAVEAEALQ